MNEFFPSPARSFFRDPDKMREETGLTEFWWERGSLRVRHRTEPAIRELYPCAYGGGGSCAFDRRKFLELGGFDELLAPFYLEDTDLGYHGVEARMEESVSAGERGVSRTPWNHRTPL